MKKIFLYCTAICCLAVGSLLQADSSLLGNHQEMKITVNNRILAQANGKAISVVDIMKKMDMLFYRQFPEFTSSSQARYQFYMANWKHVLSEMIDKELIVADAEESKLQVNASDVRQEMEELFGPNIIENLDKIGLSFDEAYDMVLADITIKRMMYFRVQMKAFSQATPQKIREYYEEVAKNNMRDNEWVYNLITIRHRDSVKAANAASLAYGLLTEDKIALDDLPAQLNERLPAPAASFSIKVSEEYRTKEKELSETYKKTLEPLSPGQYSVPIPQKSRTDNSSVVRIFFLKNKIPGGVIPFNELEAKIKMKLIEEGIERETIAYLTKLRQHFDVQDSHLQELIASGFQPFYLK